MDRVESPGSKPSILHALFALLLKSLGAETKPRAAAFPRRQQNGARRRRPF